MKNLKLCITISLIVTGFSLHAGEFPLHQVAYSGNVKRLKQLIRSGKDVNERDREGKTPLYSALAGIGTSQDDESNEQVLFELLQAPNIDVNVQDGMFKETPLHTAVKTIESGLTDVIQALIRKGADPNIQDFAGKTPLHTAVERHNLAAIRELLRTPGIRTDIKDIGGMTPLQKAVSLCNKEMILILAKAPGMRFDTKDNKGMTVLHAAILSEYGDIIYELIRIPGIRFDIKDDCNHTPLDISIPESYMNKYFPDKRTFWKNVIKELSEAALLQARPRISPRSSSIVLCT